MFRLSKSSRRRTIAVSVDAQAQVAVAAPTYLAQRDVLSFVYDKRAWIFKKVHEARANIRYVNQRQFDAGDRFLFLGQMCALKIQEHPKKRSNIHFDGQAWTVGIPLGLDKEAQRQAVRKRLMAWYRTQAKEILGGRIFHYARVIGVAPKEIAVRTQKTMWGCCDYHDQKIHMNWQIVFSPMEVIDYVVVHELCHLMVPNHSKKFWQQVQQILPDFDDQRKWLKSNALDMTFPS